MSKQNKKISFVGLIPLLVFLVTYLGSGFYFEFIKKESWGFYQLEGSVAALFATVVAFIILKGKTSEKVDTFIKGAGNSNIITMVLIFMISGSFATVAQASGATTAVVDLGLAIIPAQFLAVTIFLVAALLSTAIGSSYTTVLTLSTIVAGLVIRTELNAAIAFGALIGGAMFGDNLSLISDTTIAATQTLGVAPKDKLKLNAIIALPAALITIILLVIFGRPENTSTVEVTSIGFETFVKIIPYILVVVLASIGLNVFSVLVFGILVGGGVGFIYNGFDPIALGQSIFAGFSSSSDIIYLSLLIGGLSALVTEAGGFNWLLSSIRKVIKGRKSAEAGIVVLGAMTDLATANNTVAIVIDAPIVEDICDEFKVSRTKAAALIDITTCIFQGLIPYGAQLLRLMIIALAAGISLKVTDVIISAWYLWILLASVVVVITTPVLDRFIKDNK